MYFNIIVLSNSQPRHITHVDPRFEIGCHHDKLLLHQSTDLLVKMEQIKRQIEHYQTFESMSWDVSEISVCHLLIIIISIR